MEGQSIVAIHLRNRTADAPDMQEVLTSFHLVSARPP